MKFPFYTNLNDNFSPSNCRDISKRAFSALSSRTKFLESPVGIGLNSIALEYIGVPSCVPT